MEQGCEEDRPAARGGDFGQRIDPSEPAGRRFAQALRPGAGRRQAEPPSVPLEAALEWFRQAHPQAEVRETALVHVPIYMFKYAHRARLIPPWWTLRAGMFWPISTRRRMKCPTGWWAGWRPVYLCLALVPVVGAFLGIGRAGHGIADLQRGWACGSAVLGGLGFLGGIQSMSEKALHGLTCPRCGGNHHGPRGADAGDLPVLRAALGGEWRARCAALPGAAAGRL